MASVCDVQQPTSSDTDITDGRNRHETRVAQVFDARAAVAGTGWEVLITDVVRVTRIVLHRSAKTGLWTTTSEQAFYLTNFSVSADTAAAVIRGHWAIENSLHYTRDVTFQEDQSRIRCNPGVFARVRSFSFNILRRNKRSTCSQDRYAAALGGFDALLKWNYG